MRNFCWYLYEFRQVAACLSDTQPATNPNVLVYSTEVSMEVTVTVADIVGEYDDLS